MTTKKDLLTNISVFKADLRMLEAEIKGMSRTEIRLFGAGIDSHIDEARNLIEEIAGEN